MSGKSKITKTRLGTVYSPTSIIMIIYEEYV